MRISRTFAALWIVLATSISFSQAPQRMSYQAVVRNATGNLVTGSLVGVRISIIKGAAEGSSVYSETHAVMTNNNGLATLQIGGGSAISGTFASIDWSQGPYFVKVETDPEGGSNYTLSGISQLLSVPYALYAAQTRSQGKSTIFLTGDVTDAEAAERIAAEAGPNTENIYILDTTVLTTLDFTGLGVKTLMNLKINGNAALQNVVLDDLTQVYDTFEVSDNSSLVSTSYAQFAHLKSLHVSFQDNPVWADWGFDALSTIRCNDFRAFLPPSQTTPFPVLTSLKGSVELMATGIDLTFPQLEVADGLFFNGVASVVLPALQTGSVAFLNGEFTALTLTGFTSGRLTLNLCPNVSSISVPAFASGELKIEDCNSLTTLSAPALVSAQVRITQCGLLAAVSFPGLTSFTGNGAYISQNPALAAISFPSLTTVDTSDVPFPNVSLAYNALDTADVNSFLNQFLTVGTVYGLDLRQQPPAPPSGQGIIDKQTLISQGKNVLTN